MVMLDQSNVVNKLTIEESKEVIGGAKFSGTVINAFTSAFKVLYSFGQEFGSAIRRIRRKKLCTLSRD